MVGRWLGALLAPVIAPIVGLILPASGASRQPMAILVPAYFYPHAAGSDWTRLTKAAASGVPITAIMNPATGPGDRADANYARAVSALRAAGGKVLGYLPSSYAGRRVATPSSSCKPADGLRYTADDIISCARRYRAFYAIDGIFVDEMGGEAASASAEEVLGFYARLYDGLKAIDTTWRIVGNPGVPIDARMVRGNREPNGLGGADALVTFEGLAADFVGMPAKSLGGVHDIGAIVIETDVAFDFAAALSTASKHGFSAFFATERTLPNPYDRLPGAWDQQVEAVRAFNAARKR